MLTECVVQELVPADNKGELDAKLAKRLGKKPKVELAPSIEMHKQLEAEKGKDTLRFDNGFELPNLQAYGVERGPLMYVAPGAVGPVSSECLLAASCHLVLSDVVSCDLHGRSYASFAQAMNKPSTSMTASTAPSAATMDMPKDPTHTTHEGETQKGLA